MAHRDKVVRSISDETGMRCVDIFLRSEGTFGFEEYRRDVEEGGAWRSAFGFAERSFENEEQALNAARQSVGWLAMIPGH